MKKIRIAVMGCSAIAGRSVIPAIKSLPDHFELVSIASRSLEKAAEFAIQFGCKAVVGYENLLLENIDAVYVPLPVGLHHLWITRALENGIHVYGEKPIAASLASSQHMVDLARSRELALMEGYMFQYHPQHQIVKEIMASGEIGEIRAFSGAFGFPPLDKDNFRYDTILGGGALFDAAGYPLRALHSLLGHDFKVAASSLFKDPQNDVVIFGSAFLSNSNGVGARIAFGFDQFYQCNYEIWGSKGKITAERAYTAGPDQTPGLILEKQGSKDRIEVQAYNHFIGAMLEFHSMIHDQDGRERHYNEILLQSDSLEWIARA